MKTNPDFASIRRRSPAKFTGSKNLNSLSRRRFEQVDVLIELIEPEELPAFVDFELPPAAFGIDGKIEFPRTPEEWASRRWYDFTIRRDQLEC